MPALSSTNNALIYTLFSKLLEYQFNANNDLIVAFFDEEKYGEKDKKSIYYKLLCIIEEVVNNCDSWEIKDSKLKGCAEITIPAGQRNDLYQLVCQIPKSLVVVERVLGSINARSTVTRASKSSTAYEEKEI